MCKDNKCIIPIIISIILGTVIGALFFIGTIPATILQVPIIFATAFAGVSLLLLFIIAAFAIKKEVRECICEYGKCLAAGGIGTLIIGFFALTLIASLVAGSVFAAILLGLGGFFLVLTLLSFIGLIFCLVYSNCPRKDCFCKYENNKV